MLRDEQSGTVTLRDMSQTSTFFPAVLLQMAENNKRFLTPLEYLCEQEKKYMDRFIGFYH